MNADTNRIIQDAQERAAKFQIELDKRTQELNEKTLMELLKSFQANAIGVCTFDIMGTDPNVLRFFDIMQKIAIDREPGFPAIVASAKIGDGKTDLRCTPSATFFMGFLVGIFLSEIGKAKLILRG